MAEEQEYDIEEKSEYDSNEEEEEEEESFAIPKTKGLDKELLAMAREKIRQEAAEATNEDLTPPAINLEEIHPVTDNGRKLLRTLKEMEHTKAAYNPRQVIYHFHYTPKGQYFTTSTVDRPQRKEAVKDYRKVTVSDINLLKGKLGSHGAKIDLPSDDDLVFEEVKEKTIKKPVLESVKPQKTKADIENELLDLFSVKRTEPEAATKPVPEKKKLVVASDEYMECYPVSEEYKEIGEDPEFGERVKELFHSEEQAKEDKKWEQQRRKLFMFGGSTAGAKRGKGRNKIRGEVGRIEKLIKGSSGDAGKESQDRSESGEDNADVIE